MTVKYLFMYLFLQEMFYHKVIGGIDQCKSEDQVGPEDSSLKKLRLLKGFCWCCGKNIQMKAWTLEELKGTRASKSLVEVIKIKEWRDLTKSKEIRNKRLCEKPFRNC